MTVQGCVVFFLGVSVLGLLATALSRSFSTMKQGAGGFIEAAIQVRGGPSGPAASRIRLRSRNTAGGGEANLTLPDLTSVSFATSSA